MNPFPNLPFPPFFYPPPFFLPNPSFYQDQMLSFYMAQYANMSSLLASGFPQKPITENLTEKTVPNESSQLPPIPPLSTPSPLGTHRNSNEETEDNEVPPTMEDLIARLNLFEDVTLSTVSLIVKWVVSSPDALSRKTVEKLITHEKLFANRQIFEILLFLLQRYQTVRKPKVEFLKFLFRKSFKFIKKDFEETHKGEFKRNLNRKFKEKFFPKNETSTSKISMNFLQFKKTILIKKISNKFLKNVLANPSFFLGFTSFLKDFKNYAQKENAKKISKLAKRIVRLAETEAVDEIKSIHHLPWLDLWIEKCKNLGEEVVKKFSNEEKNKKN